MKCHRPIWINEISDSVGVEVPCGRCYACIQNRRSIWTARIMMECRVAESAYFVTLTYSDSYVPMILQYGIQRVMTLKKKDLQDYFKRLRAYILKNKRYDKDWLKKSEKTGKWSPKVRYFACGEYGPNTDRPHYHIILFNWPVDWVKINPLSGKGFSREMEEIWQLGNIEITEVSGKRAHYVTKYHLMPIVEEWIESDKREKPFAVMSRKPGIGINFITDEIVNYFSSSKNIFLTLKNDKKVPLGRYYKEKIQERMEDVDTIRKMQQRAAKRGQEAAEREREMFNNEEDFLRFERVRYRDGLKKARRQLKRNNKI